MDVVVLSYVYIIQVPRTTSVTYGINYSTYVLYFLMVIYYEIYWGLLCQYLGAIIIFFMVLSLVIIMLCKCQWVLFGKDQCLLNHCIIVLLLCFG